MVGRWNVLLGWPVFRCYVSFRECKTLAAQLSRAVQQVLMAFDRGYVARQQIQRTWHVWKVLIFEWWRWGFRNCIWTTRNDQNCQTKNDKSNDRNARTLVALVAASVARIGCPHKVCCISTIPDIQPKGIGLSECPSGDSGMSLYRYIWVHHQPQHVTEGIWLSCHV